MAKYSKEIIIEVLRNLSDQLGKKTLSSKEISSVIPKSTLNYYFGNIGNALEAAGLDRVSGSDHLKQQGPKLTDDDLFEALYLIEMQIGHEPNYSDCNSRGKYSVRPYRKRYGKWPDVIAHYQKWKSENMDKLSSTASDNSEEEIIKYDNKSIEDAAPELTNIAKYSKKKASPEQFYGEPIDFRGLRHAPINEQGVVFLFAMISRELGFNVESIQQGFPDCEGKYLHDPKKNLWAKARIEFEYKASSFEQHGHDPNNCDFIVCWVNDWPESPVDVIELKKEIRKLPSR